MPDEKDSMTPSIKPAAPVARIDYLYGKGRIGESVEYTDAADFIRDVKEQNEYGVPMALVLYADAKGETIPRDFLQDMDPPPQGVTVSYMNVPVYYESPEYATGHGELPAFRASQKANEACKDTIESAIASHYDGHIVDFGAYKQVIGAFGHERTMCILANTIQRRKLDDHFSNENREWASGIHIPADPEIGAVMNTSPEPLNTFTYIVRRRYMMQKPLKDDEIRAEADRIMRGFREASEPNSPNKTHYSVRLSENFMLRANYVHLGKLCKLFPFKSFCLVGMKDKSGRYAQIRADEDRSKPLRTVKPPSRKKGFDR